MTTFRLVALVALVLWSVACRDGRPTAPSALPAIPISTPPPAPPIGPTSSGVAGTYLFKAELGYPIHGYTSQSRYLLREDGSFALEFSSLGIELVGTYRETAGQVTFDFASDPRWGASGTLSGRSMDVTYNDIMVHSDFEHAIYHRAQ